MVKIISIEGNIGSGKSTLINRLKDHCTTFTTFIYLPEPVDLWNEIKDEFGNTIIQKYYSDKKKYSFAFQMMAYITRLSQLKKCIESSPPDSIIITERCLYTDRYVFAKMLYDTKLIEEIEYSIYIRWFDEFKNYTNVSGIIYIKTTPEICLERTKIRNRKGEETIPLEYLSSCHTYHQNWIKNFNTSNLLVIDGNEAIELQTLIDFVQYFVKD
jgi:deoxyadenosine/deoxycytidine kinase